MNGKQLAQLLIEYGIGVSRTEHRLIEIASVENKEDSG